MPTYDYICDECGHEFEAYESITLEPRKDCPECSRASLRRKIGPGAAILFKGSGFYQTDYRSESYKKAAKAEKPSDAPTKTSGESATPSSTPSSGKGSGSSTPTPSPSS
jgi:putative FmdB family regulatory protein